MRRLDIQDAPEFSFTADLRWSDFDGLGHLTQMLRTYPRRAAPISGA